MVYDSRVVVRGEAKFMWKKLNNWVRFLLPSWQRSNVVDGKHFSHRRRTAAYIQKKRLVKDVWIVSGCIILTNPVMPFLVFMGFLTTFLSFMILDET